MKRAVFLGFALAAALGLASASWAQKPPSTLSNLSVSPFEALPKGLQKAELLAREAALDLSEVVGLGKIDAAFLKTAVRADSIDVLVEFHATTKQTDYQAIKKKVVQAMGVQGVRIIQEYHTLPMSYLRINGSAALLKLLKHSNVKRIHQNQKYKPSLLQSLPLIKHPEAMRVELAPPPDRGSGSNQGANTVVAILDTGIDGLQPEFGNCATANWRCKIFARLNLENIQSTDPAVQNRFYETHGTNVAAIAASVAPSTRIFSLQIFRSIGTPPNNWLETDDANIIAAINILIDYKNRGLAKIVAANLSLEGRLYSQADCQNIPLAAAFTGLRNAGILPVVASGNAGVKDRLSAPACLNSAVSVGAVYDQSVGTRTHSLFALNSCTDHTAPDVVVCFSNSASHLTLLAPGAYITAGGAVLDGTSQAAPHIAGAIAVLRAPNVVSDDTLEDTILRMTSTGDLVRDVNNGITKPRLNLWRAVETLRWHWR